jgi:hypothetical protein
MDRSGLRIPPNASELSRSRTARFEGATGPERSYVRCKKVVPKKADWRDIAESTGPRQGEGGWGAGRGHCHSNKAWAMQVAKPSLSLAGYEAKLAVA